MDVVIKMDCEGSEFGIFETLAPHGLFGSVNAMVIDGINGGLKIRTR
jgi:hypothetical protein